MSEEQYQVWFVPTEKGKKAFGWTERSSSAPMSAEDASMEAYLMNADEPATDAREYGEYKVREIGGPLNTTDPMTTGLNTTPLKPVICIGWPTIALLAHGQNVELENAVLIPDDLLHNTASRIARGELLKRSQPEPVLSCENLCEKCGERITGHSYLSDGRLCANCQPPSSLAAPQGSAWMRVEDALPMDSQRVIAIYRGVYHHRIVSFWRDRDGNPRFGHPSEPDRKGSQPATHWHPLPELPNAQAHPTAAETKETT
jgi:hypothetical protein